jgi:GNAT superfamily N-acetyltransferase
MPDLLVRLYDLPQLESERKVADAGIAVRRALAPEGEILREWIGEHFNHHWIAEAMVGMARAPVTTLIAVKDNRLLGFACYDTTAKGFFGPTGVDEAARGQGIGEVLLIETLRAMREAGYGYAIIGSAGPVGFYQRRLDAIVIPDSDPGVYKGMLRKP